MSDANPLPVNGVTTAAPLAEEPAPAALDATPRPKAARRGFRPVLYPFVIACYPILYYYSQNAWEIPLVELKLPIQYALIGTAAVGAVLSLLLRNVHRAGLITSLIIVLIASVELSARMVRAVLEYLCEFWVQRDCPVWAPPVVVTQILLFLFLAYRSLRLKNPRAWTPFLNVFSLILVSLPISAIVRVQSKMPDRPPGVPPALAKLEPQESLPDIYYIILDGFARVDVLRDTYGYDMEPILKRLESHGFIVARNSTSNYCQTPLSLSSSLNGRYLEVPPGEDGMRLLPGREFFSDNAVYASLQPLGYQFVLFASGFDFTDQPNVGTYLSPYPYISNFHRLVVTTTPFWRFLPNSLERDSYTMTRDRSLYLFDTLPKIAKMPGPKFTFAHVLSPHPPFVFGEHGADVSPHAVPYYLSDGTLYRHYYGESAESFVKRYREQAEFLANRVEKAIEGILANSPKPPIIILQSDHGSGLNLYLESATHTDHKERMSILNAYYLPGGKSKGLTDAITPVNTFRVIFNNYFGADLPLLPERSYFSPWGEPHHFTDVTDQVRKVPAKSIATQPAATQASKPAALPSRPENPSPGR